LTHKGFLTELTDKFWVFFVCDEVLGSDVERRVKQVLEQEEKLDYFR